MGLSVASRVSRKQFSYFIFHYFVRYTELEKLLVIQRIYQLVILWGVTPCV